MDPTTTGWIGIVALFVLLFLRVPIAFAMALVGFLGYMTITGTAPAFWLLGAAPYTRVATFTFTVIPLFIFMGHLANTTGIIAGVFDAGRKWLGKVPGGMVQATVFASAAFGATSGSGMACCAVMGKIAIPQMLRQGVDRKLAIGTVAASGTLAVMIPPSNLLVIYALIANASAAALLMAGVVPGILEAVLYSMYVFVKAKVHPHSAPVMIEPVTWKDRFESLNSLLGVLYLATVIIGGIYSGVFTPTEAGAVGAFSAFILTLAMRKLTPAVLYAALLDTAKTSGMIFLILGGSAIFGFFLTITRLPSAVSRALTDLDVNRYVILAGIVLMLTILGCLLDAISIMILTVPILLPTVIALGFDPIWFGIIVVTMAEIGALTPPFGMNLFVLQGTVEGTDIPEIVRGVIPFIFMDFVRLALLIMFPMLALWLPSKL